MVKGNSWTRDGSVSRWFHVGRHMPFCTRTQTPPRCSLGLTNFDAQHRVLHSRSKYDRSSEDTGKPGSQTPRPMSHPQLPPCRAAPGALPAAVPGERGGGPGRRNGSCPLAGHWPRGVPYLPLCPLDRQGINPLLMSPISPYDIPSIARAED